MRLLGQIVINDHWATLPNA